MKENKLKHSLLTGALAGSLGIFVAKLLGLFYVVPLNSFAGLGNMAYYSIAYTYYDLLLKITQAGVPFAIAALVAKYLSKKDYKTALLVKKMGFSFVLSFSFAIAIIFFLLSKPLAFSALGKAASNEDIASLTTTLQLLLLAILVVPFLSSLRGYYQGLKRLDIYASSQVIEQIVRVSIIIFGGYLAVSILKLKNIFAIYVAILAAGIAALFTIFYLVIAAYSDNKKVIALALKQESSPLAKKAIFKEIIALGIPYIIVSFLGTTGPLINSQYFIPYATYNGLDFELAKKILSLVLVNCAKIASIPQVLALGFSAGLVPYLSEIWEKRDYILLRQQLSTIFKTVNYILLPLVIFICLQAKGVYFLMYGNNDLLLGSRLLCVYCLVAFSDTVAPIFSAILITLRFRKRAIWLLLLATFIKALLFFAFIPFFGYYGMIFSTFLASLFVIISASLFLVKQFGFAFKEISKLSLNIIVTILIAILPSLLFAYYIGFSFNQRIIAFLQMGIVGLVFIICYLFITYKLNIFTNVFGLKVLNLKSLLKFFLKC